MSTKFQKQIQTCVLERFMSEKALKELLEDYHAHTLRKGRGFRFATDQDKKIAIDWKKGMTTSELVAKYRMSRSKIVYSIALASRA